MSTFDWNFKRFLFINVRLSCRWVYRSGLKRYEPWKSREIENERKSAHLPKENSFRPFLFFLKIVVEISEKRWTSWLEKFGDEWEVAKHLQLKTDFALKSSEIIERKWKFKSWWNYTNTRTFAEGFHKHQHLHNNMCSLGLLSTLVSFRSISSNPVHPLSQIVLPVISN